MLTSWRDTSARSCPGAGYAVDEFVGRATATRLKFTLKGKLDVDFFVGNIWVQDEVRFPLSSNFHPTCSVSTLPERATFPASAPAFVGANDETKP